jgi:hypothetical protein
VTEFRYPTRALRGDYLRAGLGLVLTIGPALAVPRGSYALYVLIPIACVFFAFALRTWQRQQSRVVVDLQGISLFSPRRVSLPWANVRAVHLSYYSLKSDRTGGWMQLTLKGSDPQRRDTVRAIRIDSTLDGFEQVARRVARVVEENGVTLNDITRANFASLGIDLVGEPAAWNDA